MIVDLALAGAEIWDANRRDGQSYGDGGGSGCGFGNGNGNGNSHALCGKGYGDGCGSGYCDGELHSGPVWPAPARAMMRYTNQPS